ncbi:hypothetical protein RugamoR64_46190 [Duganella rhizosphaerae]
MRSAAAFGAGVAALASMDNIVSALAAPARTPAISTAIEWRRNKKGMEGM